MPGSRRERQGRRSGTAVAVRRQAGRGRSRSLASGVLFGMAGFLLGAACWIVLGVLALAGGPLSGPEFLEDTLRGRAAGCTSLALDRLGGLTTAEPCRSSGHLLRGSKTARVDDLQGR